MRLFLNAQWQKYWAGKDVFAEANAIQGKIYRSKEGRRTLRFEHDGRGYFLKLHTGIGWREVFKNLFSLRLPIVGAANEYRACLRLAQLGIDTLTPAAFGERGLNPARRESFLITEELANTVSLEDYCKKWREHPPTLREKRAIIRKLAQSTKTLHENGINHRDYYLCHFLRADNQVPFALGKALYLIDLHRAQMRTQLPDRWRVKDVAGLFYSAFDLPLTKRDLVCFLSIYKREWLKNSKNPQLLSVCKKAVALYRKDFGAAAPAAIAALLSRPKSGQCQPATQANIP